MTAISSFNILSIFNEKIQVGSTEGHVMIRYNCTGVLSDPISYKKH